MNNLSTNCLLFADDLVLLSESPQGLQNCLDKLGSYCHKWGLNVNLSKTKIVLFNKGGMKITRYKFYLYGEEIEIVQSYCYLGIVFASCGTFTQAIKTLCHKACKALFALKNIDTSNNAMLTFKLFDSLVSPIITYGIEAWGPFLLDENKFDNLNSLKSMFEFMPIERLNIKICKYILGVSRKSSNDAVRGELGRYPLLLTAILRWLRFTARCYSLPANNLLKLSLPKLTEFPSATQHTWAFNIKSLFTSFLYDKGLVFSSDMLFNENIISGIHEYLISKYQSSWHSAIHKGYDPNQPNKLRTYALFKNSFGMENYVISLKKNEETPFH